MLRNRLLYLFILLCTTAFFICFNGYYSWYVFLLSLVVPWLSLLLSLPGMLTLRAAVGVPNQESKDGFARTAKSTALPLQVAAASSWPLPAGRVRVRLTIENTFTGETRREVLELSPGRRPQAVEQKLTSHTCGRIICRLSKARGYDLLGLFCLPVRLKEGGSCQILVRPNAFETPIGLGPRQAPDAEGDRYSPTKPGQDPTELFGLRDYRPGDRLNRVDWKLSQKAGNMLVREASLPMARRALLLLDLSGDGFEADLLMDALATVGDALSRQEVEYVVGFSRGRELAFVDVDEPAAGGLAVEAVLCHVSRRSFPSGKALNAPQDIARIAYLCPEPEPAAIGLIVRQYPAARVAVIHTRPLDDEKILPPDACPVRVRQGSLAADLEGLTL